MHAEMADAERPSIRRLQLDERVLADLDINQLNLPFGIFLPERFGKSQRLGIISDRLIKIGYVDPDVIERDDAMVRAQALVLGNSRVDGQSSDDDSGNEYSNSAHDNLPCLKAPLSARAA